MVRKVNEIVFRGVLKFYAVHKQLRIRLDARALNLEVDNRFIVVAVGERLTFDLFQ